SGTMAPAWRVLSGAFSLRLFAKHTSPVFACQTDAKVLGECGPPLLNFRARGSQGLRDRLSREAGKQRVDQPGEQCRHRPTQRYRLELHVDASILLRESPIGTEAPEIAVVSSDGSLPLIALPEVLHFGDARRVRPAVRPGAVHEDVAHIEVGIEHR